MASIQPNDPPKYLLGKPVYYDKVQYTVAAFIKAERKYKIEISHWVEEGTVKWSDDKVEKKGIGSKCVYDKKQYIVTSVEKKEDKTIYKIVRGHWVKEDDAKLDGKK